MRTDVEFLRVIAAFGIVWFHSSIKFGQDIAYAGLVVFLILTAYFAVNSKKSHSLLSRAVRFLVPCVIWSCIYAMFKLVSGKPIFPKDYSLVSEVLSTPAVHLWYLPFTFMCLITLDKLKHYNPKILITFTTVLVALMLLTAIYWRQWSLIPPLKHYMHAAPAVLLGIIFSLNGQISRRLQFIVFSALLISLAFVLHFNLPGISQTYTVGFITSLILLSKSSFLPENNLVLRLSKLTFGIYLLHPLVIFLLWHFGITSFMVPVLAFIVSAFAIFVMLKVLPKQLSQYIV